MRAQGETVLSVLTHKDERVFKQELTLSASPPPRPSDGHGNMRILPPTGWHRRRAASGAVRALRRFRRKRRRQQ